MLRKADAEESCTSRMQASGQAAAFLEYKSPSISEPGPELVWSSWRRLVKEIGAIMSLAVAAMSLLGGALIGLAAGLLLLVNGRIFGVSGILGGVVMPLPNDTAWRTYALAGLILGGFSLKVLSWPAFDPVAPFSFGLMAVAGLLVGFGTRMGGGCTSGHGICGMSRLSPRSVVATLTFMVAGILTVAMKQLLAGGEG